MDPLRRAFLFFWVQESRRDQMRDVGRLLGANFSAGEIRMWSKGGNDKGVYQDEDIIFLPLSLSIKPELREGLMKMVGGMPTPKGYRPGANEVLVDLGQTTVDQFKDFIEQNRQDLKPRGPGAANQ